MKEGNDVQNSFSSQIDALLSSFSAEGTKAFENIGDSVNDKR